jgi:D-3-phosphoglycerate dehydrogenase
LNKILVTPRSLTKNGHPALDRLKQAGYEVVFSTPGQQPSEDELLSILPGCVGMLAGVELITAKVLESAKGLKAISRNGVGSNAIDKQAAERLGVKILITPGANARGVAELAFGHILSAVRSIPFCDSAIKNEDWQRKKGIELDGRTLGLVGCGNIGKFVAKFALGFDMKVLAYDPYKDENFKPSDDFNYCSFDELISQSDVISLHCPPSEDGTTLIDAKTINDMKDGVYIINTARAELLDDNAILKALDSGKIAALTLDVFSPEPPENWQLAKHPNVVATAHVGGFTNESVDRAVGMAVDNLINELKK